jgi:hypothetical protein
MPANAAQNTYVPEAASAAALAGLPAALVASPLPFSPDADGAARRFVGQSASDNAAALARLVGHFAHARQPIAEAGYAGKTYVSPGGDYTDRFFPVELVSGLLSAGANWFAADELQGMLDWVMTKQIAGDATTYTLPVSGGTDTYPAGTMPDSIPAGGAMATSNYVPQGDKPLLTNPWGPIAMAYHWGRKRGWDAAWAGWFAANAAKLVAAFGSVPFSPTTGLVTQYAGGFKAVGLYVLTYLDGDHYTESVWAYGTARMLAEMYARAGGSGAAAGAAAWSARADAIRDAIRAAFVEVPSPLWDYLNETFAGLARGSGLPRGYTLTAGGSGSFAVAADPGDATANILTVTSTAASYYYAGKNFSDGTAFPNPGGTPYIDKHTRFFSRAKPAQANATCALLRVDGSSGGPQIFVAFAADGHLKYYNGSGYANLPTDTTYAANTAYDLRVEATWGATNTYTVYFGAAGGTLANKGTVAIPNNTVRCAQILLGVDAGPGSITYYSTRWSQVPTTADQGPAGYLPWAQGPAGRQFSPMATAAAVYYGVLTPDQCVKASRWINLVLDQPDFAVWGAGDGRREMICQVTNYRGYVRWLRWADDWHHGLDSVYPQIVGPFSYGFFINGGYLDWGWVWLLRAIAYANPAAANTLLAAMVADAAALGGNAPVEKVSAIDKSPNGNQYLQGAMASYEAGSV